MKGGGINEMEVDEMMKMRMDDKIKTARGRGGISMSNRTYDQSSRRRVRRLLFVFKFEAEPAPPVRSVDGRL